jgi:hypothetical protein
MSLSILQSALRGAYNNNQIKSKMSFDAYAETEQQRGNRIHRYRRYYDGNHDSGLSKEMRELLRVSNTGRTVDAPNNEYDPNAAPFNANYMSMIVDTKVDRLELTGIETDNEAGDEWIASQLERNRIDSLQLQVAEAASRDGDTYLFIDFDEDTGYSKWVHESAYDGISGIVLLYATTAARVPDLAIKIWHITSDGGQTADTMRINTYSNDEVRAYISVDGGELRPYARDKDDIDDGVQANPLGRIPILHFRNNATRYDNYGRGDLDDAIPLQDALNRTMSSMIVTSELTAFTIRWALGGIVLPAKVTPGMFINLTGGESVGTDERIELGEFTPGNIEPFVNQATWITDQIYTVSKTPKPNSGGANESGEAKKQNEAPLLGKVKRAQISFGATWEDVADMAWHVEAEYGITPPAIETFNAQWVKPEVRNDKEILENAALLMAANPNFPMQEYYKIVALDTGIEQDARTARLASVGDPFGAIAPHSQLINNGVNI